MSDGALCVYTVLLGGYEALNPQPVAERSGVRFLCLTDDPALTSPHWEMVRVRPMFPMDPIRSQRMLKMQPHALPVLQDYARSLYIDNSVQLTATPEEVAARCETQNGLGLPLHSERASVFDEFIEVARLGFDDPGRIFEQLNHYQSLGEPALAERPYWTAILLRDHHNAQVQRTMERWAAHVLRYSRRDQLSLNTALRETGLRPQGWDIDNRVSWFHSWPHMPGRVRHAGMRDPVASAMPLAARARSLELSLERATARGRALEQQAIAQQAELSAAIARADAQAQRSREAEDGREAALAERAHWQQLASQRQADIEALHRHLEAVQADAAASAEAAQSAAAALRASRSWRLTAPLRWLRERLY